MDVDDLLDRLVREIVRLAGTYPAEAAAVTTAKRLGGVVAVIRSLGYRLSAEFASP